MTSAYAFDIRLLSCERCGAPIEVPEEGGQTTCSYCGAQMLVQRRSLGRVQVPHSVSDEQARLAKLRMQVSAPLTQNPYSLASRPPGCEALAASLEPEGQAQLEQRWREAAALVRREPSFEHQRLAWWCATMLSRVYGLTEQPRKRRAVLESSIELLVDPGFCHVLYASLAKAAAAAADFTAGHRWIEQCDPKPEDIMLDSAYRIGRASILAREGHGQRTLEVVGDRANDLPESTQDRMMFAAYRIHAYELLDRLDEAIEAATVAMQDPEAGKLVLIILKKNELAPGVVAAIEGLEHKTGAQAQAGTAPVASADPPPSPRPPPEPFQLPSQRAPAPAEVPKQMLWIALLVVVIVLAAVAAGVLPMLKRMGIL